jgi:hypothetical protein
MLLNWSHCNAAVVLSSTISRINFYAKNNNMSSKNTNKRKSDTEIEIEAEIKKKFHNDLYTYLVCQKCKIVPKTGAIYVCTNGEHATCRACFNLSDICNICQAKITTPSKGLEQIRTSLPMSCKHRKNGCTTIETMDFSLLNHELECECRPIFCPILSCQTETVIFKKLGQHLTEHGEDYFDIKQSFCNGHMIIKEETYSGSNRCWKPFKFLLNESLFFFEMALKDGRFYFWMYYHGSPEEAKNYKATIKIFNNGDNHYIYNDTIRSLDESKETIFTDECALVISAKQVRRLGLDLNEKLQYSVKVTCVCPNDGNK